RCLVTGLPVRESFLDGWLDGLDTVFGIKGIVPGLWSRAKARGIRTVLMPNAEELLLEGDELGSIDLFIGSTRACCELLAQSGFGSRTEYIPRAIDTERFAFQRRERANVFLHCRGWANLER